MPSFNCDVDVNTTGLTDLSDGWKDCTSIVNFPAKDFSSGINFSQTWDGCTAMETIAELDLYSQLSNATEFVSTWEGCYALISFQEGLNLSSATVFDRTWASCSSLTSFPFTLVDSGTTFTSTWEGCSSLTSFPLLNVSSGTNFRYAWYDCQSLTTFPLLNVSSGTNFLGAWAECTSLTSFPLLDVSNGTNFNFAWYNCQSLTTFPLLDVSSGTNFELAWASCESLTTFPLLDVSSGTNFELAWAFCTSLTSFPLLDVSSGTNFGRAWDTCESLTTFPQLDVSSGTDFSGAWALCTSLTSFPLLDVSNGIDFSSAWSFCTGLTSFPLLDVSSGTNFNRTWDSCESLTTFPQLDVSSGTDFGSAWSFCTGLTSFPLLDVSNGTYFSSAWQNCISLTTFPAGMFDTCTATNFDNAWTNCALTPQSIENILVSLDTSGVTEGLLDVSGGTNACSGDWTVLATAAYDNLIGKSWTIAYNDCPPCDLPPYGCNTSVNPSCVTNFFGAWDGCSSLTSFPLLNVSNGTNFNSAWYNCESLTTFPLLDVSSGTNFGYAWSYCTGLTSFPLLDVSSGTNFFTAWATCNSLTSFPLLDVSSGTNFYGAWQNCISLTTFPAGMFDTCTATNFDNAWTNCALTPQSIENILVSLDTSGVTEGLLGISGGTNACYEDWTVLATAAYSSLISKSWTIAYNYCPPAANRWLAYSIVDEGSVNSNNLAIGPSGEIYSFIANTTGSELSKFSINGDLQWSKTITPPNVQLEWYSYAVSQTIHSLPSGEVLAVVDDNTQNHNFFRLDSSGQGIYTQAYAGSNGQNWELRALNNAKTQMLVSELQAYQPHFCNLIDVTNGSFLKRFSFTRPSTPLVWRIVMSVQKPDGNWVLGGYLNNYIRFLVEVDETFTNVVQAVDLGLNVSLDAIIFHEESGGYLLLDGEGGGKIHHLDEFLQPTETRTFGGWPTSMQPSPNGFYIWNSYVNFYSDLYMPGWPSLVNLIDYNWNLNEVSFFTQVNGISPYTSTVSLDTENQRVIITPGGIDLYGGGTGPAAYKYVSSLAFLQPLTAGGTPIFADNPPGYGLYARSEINPTTLPVISPPTITATSVSMSIVSAPNVPIVTPTLSFQNSAQIFNLETSG